MVPGSLETGPTQSVSSICLVSVIPAEWLDRAAKLLVGICGARHFVMSAGASAYTRYGQQRAARQYARKVWWRPVLAIQLLVLGA
jgi:predicted amidohydrolase YtcJ